MSVEICKRPNPETVYDASEFSGDHAAHNLTELMSDVLGEDAPVFTLYAAREAVRRMHAQLRDHAPAAAPSTGGGEGSGDGK